MLRERLRVGLTFDDVLLVPAHSTVLPHETDLTSAVTRKLKLAVPIISAAMDTVTEARLASAMAQEGALGVIHKNMTPSLQAAEVRKVKAGRGVSGPLLAAAAVGVGADRAERVKALIEAGCDIIVIDTAHGHSQGVLEAVRLTRLEFGRDVHLVAGNVATGDGAKALVDAGVDAVKVGIGPGSICTTRIVAGVGVPQITAIADCAEALKGWNVPLWADGGIQYSGDIVKAFAAGASAVMLGSLLAGTDEAPGEVVSQGGQSSKSYRGMGSIAAMRRGSKDRYFQGGVEDAQKLVPEGVEGRVAAKGPLAQTLFQLVGGLRSGMGYLGCRTISDLQTKAEFIQITAAGLRESHIHHVALEQPAPNYVGPDRG